MSAESELADADLVLEGRIMPASNAAFIGELGGVKVVYKPIAGERPLWDFPDGSLGGREVAAYAVSDALGWNIVPRSWLHDGPFGLGMVQIWREPDPEQEAVAVVDAGTMPTKGWRHVFDGLDDEDRPLSLIHEDSGALRRIAVFDIVTNNADRKGGHILAMADGHRHGIDHGLTFHAEHKLRTVLWGWRGQDLHESELSGVERLCSALTGSLGATLSRLLDEQEVEAMRVRCERLMREARFPAPEGAMPAIPWPPF